MKLNSRAALAGTMLALMGGVASAATVNVAGQPITYSKEGLALAGSSVTLPAITVTLGNNYTYQDDIYIALTGGALLSSTMATTPPTVLCGASVVGFVTQTDAATLNFRVTDQAGITSGTNCVITGLRATSASIGTSANFGVSWTANRFVTGQLLDTGSTAANTLTAKEQLVVKVTQPLDNEIDVTKQRKQFATPTDDPTPALATQDTLQTTVSNSPASFTAPTVSVQTVAMTLVGDFSWTDGADSGTTCSQAEIAGYISAAGFTVSSSSSCSKVILTQTGAPLGDLVPFVVVNIPGTVSLNSQEFTGTVQWDYTQTGGTATGTKTASFAPGEWTYNGAVIYINYMPYGSDISRIIYVSNRGTQDGAVDGTVYDETGKSCAFTAGNLAAGTIKQLSGTVDTAVASCFGSAYSGKVHMIVQVTAPANSIESYSAYKVGANDRGTVVNTSNGRIVINGNSK